MNDSTGRWVHSDNGNVWQGNEFIGQAVDSFQARRFVKAHNEAVHPSGGGQDKWREYGMNEGIIFGDDPNATVLLNFKDIADAHNATLPPRIGSALDMLCEVEDCTELAEHRCKKHSQQ